MRKDQSASASEFQELLAGCQGKLLAYIFSLLPDMNEAQDVLQQTVLQLWENFEQYDREKSFASWAYTFARYQVLSFVRDRRRSRVVFSDDLIAKLAERQVALPSHDDRDDYREAIAHCESKLKANDRALLRRCYVEEVNVGRVSAELNRSTQSVCNSLKRIRSALFACVRRRLNAGDSS